jgi:hypothetical protein
MATKRTGRTQANRANESVSCNVQKAEILRKIRFTNGLRPNEVHAGRAEPASGSANETNDRRVREPAGERKQLVPI